MVYCATDLSLDRPVAVKLIAPGFACLPVGMAEQPSAGTGTVMRPHTLRRYAEQAGFARVEVLAIEHDMFRFYRLHG
jgi:hypothetical protein